MNRKLLQKVLDELGKETPKLDYVRGILETMMESMPEEVKGDRAFVPIKIETPPATEAELMDAKAKAAIANIKRLAAESTIDVKNN